MATRERLAERLRTLGFDVLPSATNFVFARHTRHRAGDLAQALRERAILVRHFKSPGIDNYLRISIGTDEECAQLVAALEDITASSLA